MRDPVLVGRKVAKQVAAEEFSATRLQGVLENVPVAVLVLTLVNDTMPAGVVAPDCLSLTVAVQVVAWLIATVGGLHTTAVVVLCLADTAVTVTTRVVLLLPPTLSAVVRVTVNGVVMVGLKV